MLTVPRVLSAMALPLEEEEHEMKVHDRRERGDMKSTAPPEKDEHASNVYSSQVYLS